MGKRMKEKKSKENENAEFAIPTCTHVRKAIDSSLLKKSAHDVNWNVCQDCKSEGDAEPQEEDEDEDEEESECPTIWVCLRCGHRGCGRNSEHRHAIKHYEKPHSDTHCLVLSMDNWIVWCYICDDVVQYSSTGQLAQLVASIKKQALTEPKKESNLNEVVKKESQVADDLQPEPVEKTPFKENKTSQKNNVQRKDVEAKEHKPNTSKSSPAVCVIGLNNLGNTCFFNAVVQNLSQTLPLREVLQERLNRNTNIYINPDMSSNLEPIWVHLDPPGSLTMAMYTLLKEIQDTTKGVVTPKELFTQICKQAARFKGFQQQDSQELLRYLLDGMRAEEMKCISLGIREALRDSGVQMHSEEGKKLIKDYEKNEELKNLVDHVFGGELTSTVMCKECQTVSIVTEMFLDLSLPVSDEAYRKKNPRKIEPKYKDDHIHQDSSPQFVNNNDEVLSGAGSKYQQKKAKKQAKKQVKNQRRMQKLGGKVIVTDQDSPDCEAEQAGSQAEVKENECEISNEDQHSKHEEEEEDPEPTTSSVNNRFTVLSGSKEELDHLDEVASDNIITNLNSLSLDTAFVAPDDIQLDVVEDSSSLSSEYTIVNQDPELAFHTLAQRTSPDHQECSLHSCLYQFTEMESLTQNNQLMCVTCTKRQTTHRHSGAKKPVYTDAIKQILISSPPAVLTLHLKRFQQVGYSICKVNRHVQFTHLLDLAPYCSKNCKNIEKSETTVMYSLYGIVEHSGTMRSGHYTAYVKSRPAAMSSRKPRVKASGEGVWFYVSDTSVQQVSELKVQTSEAYLLFYERVS